MKTEKMTEWISVEKDLPKEDGEVLVTLEMKLLGKPCTYIDIAYFSKDLYAVNDYEFQDKKGIAGFYKHSSEWGEDYEVNPIAWQPLPEPYKEAQND